MGLMALMGISMMAGETVKIVAGNLVLMENWEGHKLWGASSADYMVKIAIETDDYFGTFDETMIDKDLSFVGELDADEKTGENFAHDIVSGTVVISQTELGSYLMTGTVKTHDNMTFEFEFLSAAGLKYDAQTSDYEALFSWNDAVLRDSKWDDLGGLTLELYNKKNQMAVITFVCDKKKEDPDIKLPMGEYEVSDSQEAYTVVPSVGVIISEIFPSFAGTIGPKGVEYPVWFFLTGKVVVEKTADGARIEVNAQNSCYRAIHIVVEGGALGVEETVQSSANVRKCMRAGNIYIERAGAYYNLLGGRE